MRGFDILFRWNCPNCFRFAAEVIELSNDEIDSLGDNHVKCQFCEHEIRVHWVMKIEAVASHNHMRLAPVAVVTDVWKILFPDDAEEDEIPEFDPDSEFETGEA